MTIDQMGDWPYTQEADRAHQQQLEERQRVQQDIEEAWKNLMMDRDWAKEFNGYFCSNSDDIKLLKWALSIRD